MRKFALIASACTVLLIPGSLSAQQIDLALGANSILSSHYNSSAQGYRPPAEKGGMYPSFSLGVFLKNRIGVNGEIAVRAKRGLYNGYQNFRPVFYDVNAVYAPRLGKNASADLMAGIGGESLLFYNHFGVCSYYYPSGCSINVSSNHLMGHIGGDVRYYFWHRFFVRPEAHLYLIRNNFEFNSNYVGRLGVSIGYSFNSR